MKKSKDNPERKHTTVTIPKPLYENIKKRIENTGFGSVSDYVTFVLREVVSAEGDKKAGKEDENSIKKKLKALGYI